MTEEDLSKQVDDPMMHQYSGETDSSETDVGNEPDPELTTEIVDEINHKRELLSSNQQALRFVSIKEHLDLVRQGETNRVIEANIDRLRSILAKGSWDGPGLVEGRGGLSSTWGYAAQESTRWHSADHLMMYQEALDRYRKIHEDLKKEDGTMVEARSAFGSILQKAAIQYLKNIYRSRFSADGLEYDSITLEQLLGYAENDSTEDIDDTHRERLIGLIKQDPSQLNKEDIRFLMRFYKEDLFVASDFMSSKQLPYELLQIWDLEAVKEGSSAWADDMGFVAIPQGTKSAKLLGVVALMGDKELCEELKTAMLAAAHEDSMAAHLVIDVSLREYYPKRGTYYGDELTKDVYQLS
jgi:hypothetical protein